METIFVYRSRWCPHQRVVARKLYRRLKISAMYCAACMVKNEMASYLAMTINTVVLAGVLTSEWLRGNSTEGLKYMPCIAQHAW